MKAQSLPADMLLSLLVMSILALYAMSSYDDYNRRHDSLLERRTLENTAFYLSEALIRTPGSPANWTSCVQRGGQNIPCLRSIGLSDGWNSFDLQKVNAIERVNSYPKLKGYMGLDYDFFLTIKRADGSIIVAKGRDYSDRNSVSVTRLAEYNGTSVVMRLTVYENP